MSNRGNMKGRCSKSASTSDREGSAISNKDTNMRLNRLNGDRDTVVEVEVEPPADEERSPSPMDVVCGSIREQLVKQANNQPKAISNNQRRISGSQARPHCVDHTTLTQSTHEASGRSHNPDLKAWSTETGGRRRASDLGDTRYGRSKRWNRRPAAEDLLSGDLLGSKSRLPGRSGSNPSDGRDPVKKTAERKPGRDGDDLQ
ncbi:hypothetical protein TRIUR3_30994 [Triticum urartu]|uniref:Uncharacterized protein n=1 Tax=Triticum urartu TaxID=4572 RepID=M8ABR3_TRIUA|nr:hypothetical protein TRIUR3_30994 [Triticum urartu]